jgi:transcriptional regulator with XRE-family HTH domain
MTKPKKADAILITSDQARAARRQLGLTQKQVITESGLSGYKMKQFETGSFNPEVPFLQALAEYYVSKGVELTSLAPTPAPAPAPASAPIPVVPQVQRACFYVDGSVSGDLLDKCLERMQNIDQRIADILKKPVHTGLFSDYTEETVKEHQELFGALGEGYLIISLLLGRPIVQAADPDAGKPKTHADLLSQFYAQSPIVTGEDPNPEPVKEKTAKVEKVETEDDEVME